MEKVSPPPEDVARLFRALGGPKGTKEISSLARFSSSRSSGMLCHAATIANPIGVTLFYLSSQKKKLWISWWDAWNEADLF